MTRKRPGRRRLRAWGLAGVVTAVAALTAPTCVSPPSFKGVKRPRPGRRPSVKEKIYTK